MEIENVRERVCSVVAVWRWRYDDDRELRMEFIACSNKISWNHENIGRVNGLNVKSEYVMANVSRE